MQLNQIEPQRCAGTNSVPPQVLECADWSALSAGDLSPSSANQTPDYRQRAAQRDPALATSRQSGKSGDESPHSKALRFTRELAL